jgi:hypothetical protein
MARVTAAGGRIAISAWIPEGTVNDGMSVVREAVARATGGPGPPQFAWHSPDALAGLLAPHGFGEIAIHEERLAFTGASAREYLESEGEHHPMAVASRAMLERSGEGPAVFERMLAIFEAGNEDPTAFRVTSRYIVAVARRDRP